MPKRVHLPDGRIVNFPDSMSAAQIQATVTKLVGTPQPAKSEPSSSWLGPAVAAGGALAAGVALRKPELLKKGASKAFDVLQGARHLGALSGTAVPKSVLSNVGAPFVAAAEKKSLEPIKQFFSKRTFKDWTREMSDPEAGIAWAEPGAESTLRMWNPFGRLMSAGDVATRKALTRANLSPKEAARYTLQTPIGELGIVGKAQKALESKPAKAAVLYRRTPLNVLIHGASVPFEHPGLATGAAVAGATQGATGGEISDPLTIALTAPLTGVYSLPYLMGAASGKFLATGSKGEAARVSRGLAPVPEDVGSTLLPTELLRPINKPAIVSFMERLSRLAKTGKSY